MDVHVKLLSDNVCEAEDNKTGLFSVGVDCFNQLYLRQGPIPLPTVKMSTIKRKYNK